MTEDAKLKLALIQMNSSDDRDANLAKAGAMIDQACAEHRPDLVLIPEFFNIPYVFQYRDYRHIDRAERDDGPSISMVRERAIRHKVHVMATIFEEERAGIYFDTAILIAPTGDIVGKYRKVHPAARRSLEKIYFRHGTTFPVFRIGDWRIGTIICYDTFFPESARAAALNGAEVILVPFATPDVNCWRPMMRTRAFENGAYFAPCNKVGREGEWTFMGSSMIVDPYGEIVTELDDAKEGIIAAELSRAKVFEARRYNPMMRDRRPDLYLPITTASEDIPRV
jgi:N-carbamoylputrescine amidase